MPIYEYVCDKCRLKFEKINYRITDKKEVCPRCYEDATKVPSIFSHKTNESKHIPKEIDLRVGRESEKRWLDYEDRKKEKEKVRKEHGTQRLSREINGEYTPLSLKKDGKEVSEKEAVSLRKEMLSGYTKIRNDPETKKFIPQE